MSSYFTELYKKTLSGSVIEKSKSKIATEKWIENDKYSVKCILDTMKSTMEYEYSKIIL